MKDIDEGIIWELMIKSITKEVVLIKLNIDRSSLQIELYELLKYSIEKKHSRNIEFALYLVAIYELEYNPYLDLLNKLILCGWHRQHENVASALDEIRSPKSTKFLYKAILLKHDCLAWDENFAFERKCVWALAKIGTLEAKEKLNQLKNYDNELISGWAKKRIQGLEQGGYDYLNNKNKEV